MRCLVTAGPAYEALDRVRRLTNLSTGSLGSLLAARLAGAGHEVLLLRGQLATAPPPAGVPVREFTTTTDLAARFLEHATDDPVAVFHAAAVADFSFGEVLREGPDGRWRPVAGGKIATGGGTLRVELRPTPKLLVGLRDWYPAGLLVGWKYEVEGPREAVLQAAVHQIGECRTDACVANGPGFGPGFGIVGAGAAECEACADVQALLGRLAELTGRWAASRNCPPAGR